MVDLDVRETRRLRLRRWRDSDREAFAAMNGDAEVMRYFPNALDRAASDALLDDLEQRWQANGVGLWSLQRRQGDPALLGWTGLNPMPPGTPGAGEWEVGWRLARPAWGHGYATEAACEALLVARTVLRVRRVWSFTTRGNQRSQAVMRRLGLVEHSRFEFTRLRPVTRCGRTSPTAPPSRNDRRDRLPHGRRGPSCSGHPLQRVP